MKGKSASTETRKTARRGKGAVGGAEPDVDRLKPDRMRTGIEGLDDILGGGLPKGHLYLVEGDPGTGPAPP